ncbi:MAG: hypothetical protein HY608_10180 [Planctomycetes bacterium]|nr:hypothetical protein [Planctomycetota bacterium]
MRIHRKAWAAAVTLALPVLADGVAPPRPERPIEPEEVRQRIDTMREAARGQLGEERYRAIWEDPFRPGTLRSQPEAIATLCARERFALRAGDDAPDFTLTPAGGGEPFTLSSMRGTRPVALVFGSYT